MKKYVSSRFPHLVYGGDYNPDQWLDYPEILEQDVILMKQAGINCVSLGIFAWARLEPSDGVYDFSWLDLIIDRLYENGIYTILATPSGGRPYWLSAKYPETSRVDVGGVRQGPRARHNHCFSSPIMKQKTTAIDRALAEHYQNHPAIIMWHISNEFSGDCHCELCRQEFREYLKEKYKTLDQLNQCWWGGFWSHVYTDWDQIQSPMQNEETGCHGLNLDWKRFVTKKTVDFVRMERDAVREFTPDLPVTINMMGLFDGLDYFKFSDVIDVSSWDSYPEWDNTQIGTNTDIACNVALMHDIMRSVKKGKPYYMMESSPSATNWQPVSKLRRPGVVELAALQAIAHGSDSVQYFQIRKGRGGSEKFHGAVIDHYGKADTRVFSDVASVGARLKRIDSICGSIVKPQVLMIYDYESMWALNDAAGPRNCGMHYQETLQEHYRPFWENGVAVDFGDCESSFDGYRLVVAPMLYMTRAGIADRMKEYVSNGGTLVLTYHSGIVDEHDLCYLGGMPGELIDLVGLRSEEIDALYDGEHNGIVMEENNLLGMSGKYTSSELMDQIVVSTAEVLGRYTDDFYAGNPCLTVNSYGQGKVYYIASKNDGAFLSDFYRAVRRESKVQAAFDGLLPKGVAVGMREDADTCYAVLQNYGDPVTVKLPNEYYDLETGEKYTGQLTLEKNEAKVLYYDK